MKLLLLLSVLVTAAMHAEETHTQDSLDSIRKAVTENKAVLLDVREKEEWDAGHLKSAKLVPLSSLKTAASAPADVPKDKPVYVHCRSGKRSLVATEILKKFGIDARALKPGYEELSQHGFEKDAGK
ncbi:MAG TPA: rhodanese-like domain-containing protein [Planctomycetota bacterium]|nr:rhodanese-like domain-containing protein [Planctomycetota bacterium]